MTTETALHDAIEGSQTLDGLDQAQRNLVRLAWEIRRVEVAGPGPRPLQRMATRFDLFLAADPEPGWKVWLAGWLGEGGMPRPVAQRLAAAGLLLGAVGFGGAAATGTSAQQVLSGAASFAVHAIENLTPRSGGEADTALPGEPTETRTTDPTPSPTPEGTPSPQGAAGTEPPGAPTADDGSAGGSGTPPPPPAATPTPTPRAGILIPPATAGSVASPTASSRPERGEAETETPPALEGTATPPVPPGETATASPPAAGGFATQSYSAGPAGTVTLRYSATTIEVVSVAAAAGWQYDVSDVENLSLKVEFQKEGHGIVFRATLENGAPVTSLTEDDGEEESED